MDGNNNHDTNREEKIQMKDYKKRMVISPAILAASSRVGIVRMRRRIVQQFGIDGQHLESERCAEDL
jgi:hypothetical protein